MPELPEVEHAARCLRAWLDGTTIVRAEAPASRVFREGGRALFRRLLAGRRLERVDRHGKVLLVQFDDDVGLLSHLGMTGRWVRRPAGERVAHARARLVLSDGSILHYSDPRMFGRLEIHRTPEIAALPSVRELGPDPLLDGIDVTRLHAALARTSRPVKVAIMDQSILAGIGNIQATEALFRAGIHPARPARTLSRRDVARLARAIDDSLAHTLARMDDGEIAYLSDGAHVDNPFLVYDRAAEPCPRCRRPLEHMTLGGRSSVFCARCQPLGEAEGERC
jgi:formamidopyrimidine-DNA glycosylase